MNPARFQSSPSAKEAILGSALSTHQRPSSLSEAESRTHWSCRRSLSIGTDLFLLAILSPFAALSIDYVPKALLAIVILDIPLQFGTHLFYRESDAALGALGGLSISATTIALAGLYISWFLRTMVSRSVEVSPSRHLSTPLVLYTLFTALSVLVAQDVGLSLFELFLVLEAGLAYFYVANMVRTKQDVLFVISLLLIACVLEGAVIDLMSVTVTPSTAWNLPVHLHADWSGHGRFVRLGGTVGSPNVAAAYLSISLTLASSLLFTNLPRSYKWLAMAALAFGCVALILTFSRGGWIALALGTSLLGLAIWHQRGLSWKMPIAAVVLLTFLYLPFHAAVSTRLLGDDQGSAESRVPLMHLAFRMIAANPLLGVGANNFTVAMNRCLTPEFRQGFLFAVHNKYLLVMAETGLGGFLALVAFLLGTVRLGWQCWRYHDQLLSPLALGLTTGIMGHMVHMTVDVFRGRPTQQLLWVIAGLLAAMLRACNKSRQSDSLPKATEASSWGVACDLHGILPAKNFSRPHSQ